MYNLVETEASKSALLEIALELKRYHADMVLTGGWAPYFITNKFFPHCGSIDIDFVLKTTIMEKYDSIKKSVLTLGYQQENEFRFSKEVPSPIDNNQYAIHLDFLCDREGLKYTHIRDVQNDLKAFAFEGSNIAFDFNYEQEIAAILPRNGKDKTTVKVVDLVGSLLLKGQAMHGRAKPKDFYDVYALTFFNGSAEKSAEYFNGQMKNKKLDPSKEKLMKHSLSVIKQKFETPESSGPYQVELFTNNETAHTIIYDQVSKFLKAIKIN